MKYLQMFLDSELNKPDNKTNKTVSDRKNALALTTESYKPLSAELAARLLCRTPEIHAIDLVAMSEILWELNVRPRPNQLPCGGCRAATCRFNKLK